MVIPARRFSLLKHSLYANILEHGYNRNTLGLTWGNYRIGLLLNKTCIIAVSFRGADDRQRLNAAECAALDTSRASGHCIVQLRLSTHRLYMQAASRGAGACISTTLEL